ncbi:MAG TPA: 30S ribosomal protein S20 [Actinomycetota bacterium]|nr:30S ribosomal protein S20 [Actinomycetota bacterium]
MANIKSQKKRILTNERRRVRNREYRTALKTYIKRFNAAVAGGDADLAQSEFRRAARALDKAVSKGIIHRNNAANKKSSMASRINNS